MRQACALRIERLVRMKETFRSLVFVVCIAVLCSVLFGCTTDTNAFSRNSSIASDSAYPYVDDSHEPATVSMPSNDTSHTASEEQAFIPQAVMMAYLDFLHNNVMFYEYYNNRQTLHAYENFADFLHQEDGITLELKRIAIIDIYGDGIKELILSMKHPASASIREIVLVLTCDDNTLYGIRLTQRSFSSLKKDGTYFSSEVAPGHWGIMRLQYSSGTFWFDEMRSPSYYESYNEFWDFVEEQEQKENAEWVTYSEASIAEDLADAWEVNTIS